MTQSRLRLLGRTTAADEGVSMVEMMVALVVIAIVASASIVFFVNNIRSVNNQRQHQEAVYVANQQIESVQALPVAKLVKGRTQAEVQAQFATAAATSMNLASQDDVSNPGNYDSSATTAGAEVVPVIPQTQTVNKVPFSLTTFIGVCWYDAKTGVCGPTSSSTTNKEYRVSIYESWQSAGPCKNSCQYTTSTLIDPTADPLFNSNISAPTGTLTTPSSGTVYTNNTYSDTCTTNAGTSAGTLVAITNGTNMKSNIGVRISSGGGTVVNVAQPTSTEVDFCLITGDSPGTYTITVINTDGGHFQVPITELPNITGASGWTPAGKTLTLSGGGFETGAVVKDNSGNSLSYQLYQCSTAPYYNTFPACGGVAGPDQLAISNFTGPTNGATKTLTLTNPDSSSDSWTITAPTATGYASVPQGKAYWVLGQTTSLTVTGTGFSSSTGVISGSNGSFTASNLSSTSERLVLTGGTVGSESAQLYNPDGGTTVSGTIPLDAAPTVTTATPNTVKASKSGTTSTYTTIALVGTNFVSGMTATATNGAAVTGVTFTNATHLSFTLNAPTTKTTTITLTNPVDGATVSFAIGVTPTITALAPTSITHNTTTTFTITGTGFASGAAVALTEAGGGLTETNVSVSSATSMTFKAKTNNTNKSGSTTLTVTVTNADGSVSNTFSSTVSVN